MVKGEIFLDDETSCSVSGKINAKSLCLIKVQFGDGGLEDDLIEGRDNKYNQITSYEGMMTLLAISQETSQVVQELTIMLH